MLNRNKRLLLFPLARIFTLNKLKIETKQFYPLLHKRFSKDKPQILNNTPSTIPSNCNIFQLARILNENIIDLTKEYKSIMNYEIRDELEILSRDDLELFLLEKGLEVQIQPYNPKLVKRPIIVTIMGHVDHGKTTLLDTLRNTNLVEKEFGKITQTIGAFSLDSRGEKITIIDTPGHEAFSKMRMRGARVTDCIILVVSIIEGPQNQTLEVIRLAENYNIPIIVAVNKIDRCDDLNPQILNDLYVNGLKLEKFGGNVPAVFISAKKRTNIDKLEDEIIKLSQKLDLKEDVNVQTQCYVIESKIESNTLKNSTASIIVNKGILREGDCFVCGNTFGKVRQIKNEYGENLSEAYPGQPVEITGFKSHPNSGSLLIKVDSQVEAEDYISDRLKFQEYKDENKKKNLGLGIKLNIKDNKERRKLMRSGGNKHYLQQKIEGGEFKSIISKEEIMNTYLNRGISHQNVFIFADCEGALETIIDELNRVLGSKLVEEFVICKKIGGMTDNDFREAKETKSTIFCFNLEVMNFVEALSQSMKVGVRYHKLIYDIVEEIRVFVFESAMKVPNIETDIITGKAEIKELFKLKTSSKVHSVAGIEVITGTVYAGNKYRLIREGDVIKYGMKTYSFKQNKVSINSLGEGEQCGVIFEDFDDLEKGDILECYDLVSNVDGISETNRCVTCYK